MLSLLLQSLVIYIGMYIILLSAFQPPEPTVRMADMGDVMDGICKLRKTYNTENNYIY